MATKKVESFTGREDVKKFITKCDLHCNIKGYDGEKKAAFIAGRLEEPAFDVYMALSDEDKKDPEKIKTALLGSFDNAKKNREVALEELRHRRRLGEENPEVFAHKLLELCNYAYPKFTDDARKSLAKDHYVKGLGVELQKELRKTTDFEDKSLDDLVKLTTYFEIADTNASTFSEPRREEIATLASCGSANAESRFESRLDRLCTLMERSLNMGEEEEDPDDRMNYVASRGSARNPSNNFRRRNFNRGGGGRQQPRKCRACNGTDHLFRKCPKRYCQSCGKQGHDGWEKECPKYQL